MLILLTMIAMQSPAPAELRLSAPASELSLALVEPDASRVRLTNDGKLRLRFTQPYFETTGSGDAYKQCVLWDEGSKPHAVSQPADGHQDKKHGNYVLFRDADLTFTQGETVELGIRCAESGPQPLTLIHAMIGQAGKDQVFWVIYRTTRNTNAVAVTTR
jgi:hypothetical protein